MRTRSVAAALLIALAPVTFSSASFAQGADDPTVKAARARFNEGVDFFDKGQFENARASFLQAYALHKHPTVLLNLAQSSLRAGHALEASKYFQQYLRESQNLTAAQRADAEQGLAEARAKLGRIEVSAATGADVFVDGERVGVAPLAAPIDVDAGAHTVKTNADSRTVTVVAGQLASVRFGAAPPPVVGGPLPAPPAAPEAPPAPGDALPPAAAAPPAPAPAPAPADTGPGLFSPPEAMTPVYLGGAVALVGVAGAIVFAVFKGSANSSYEGTQNTITQAYGSTPPGGFCVNNPPSNYVTACQNLQTNFNQINLDATMANVSVVVGVVGLAFGLGWYLFAPKRATSSGAARGTFAPILQAHRQGAGFALQF